MASSGIVLHRPPARHGRRRHEQEHQEPVARRELDDAVDHLSRLSESSRKLPEVTMRSPALMPAQDLDAVAELRADFDVARLEGAVAAIEEDRPGGRPN